MLAHPLAFRLLARLRHDESDVRAGEFMFPAHESADDVLRRLIEGGAQTAKWITIPEGYTSKQIASDLAAHGLGAADAFEQTFASEHLILDGTRTVNLEGYLFPDTYLVPVQTTPHAVAALLTGQFRSELPADAASKAKALRFTVPQIITVASLIEREAKADDERALMAGVYYNRMKRGMPLEVDATIEYIFPEHHTEITRADLRIDSPYNTYLHEGLPPTPIANPGRASIVAAFNPQPSDYLYYVYRGDGHHAFARTLAEHNANVERYLR